MTQFLGFSSIVATQILKSSFYSQLCSCEGLVFPDLLRPEVIDFFPILTRATLAHSVTEMLVDPEAAFAIYSSGTTGKPICVYRSADGDLRNWNIIRYACSLQHKPVLNGFFLCSIRESKEYQLRLKFTGFSVNIERCNQWKNSEKCRKKTQTASLIVGSPEGISWILRENIKPQALAYYSTALPLSESIRQQTKHWRTKIFHTYSSTETGAIAWQCTADTSQYHVFPDIFVEIGSGGVILVTKLYPSALPLLRYATGDEAELTSGLCVCGFRGSTLTGLLGRKN